MTHPPNIALLIELSSVHARGLLRGISAYSQAKGPWRLHLIEQLRVPEIRRALDTWDGDGLIARVETNAIARLLVERGLPVVNISGTSVVAPWPRVDTDNDAVCRMAAGHLVERGYHHFGFCGMTQYEWSGWRRDCFAAELRQQGMPCSILELASLTSDRRMNRSDGRRLARWIAGLPRPAGIMACNDHCGRAVLDVCSELAVSVPDDVGVIGVDNDDLVCELCVPPLSSIEVNCERIGYAAAENLDRMLRKAGRAVGTKLIRPTTLVRRRSTDASAVRDPFVAEAVRFIRAYASEDIDVPAVAGHVGVSRRYLEQQFQKSVGRTIHAELLRVRLENAQRLLGETDWKLQTIAERSGFKQASHLSSVFKEKLGLRPGQYRQRLQNRP